MSFHPETSTLANPEPSQAGQRGSLSVTDCSLFGCILADPPWPFKGTGAWKSRKRGPNAVKCPYPTMTIEAICALPVATLAAPDAHLWLWTDNTNLRRGFEVMEAWGFRYLAPVTWVKDSGVGMWFVHRTQTLLMGYKEKCVFDGARYRPTVLLGGTPKRHSEKPESSYQLIESISRGPRLEMFARRKREGWSSWGNEVPCDVVLSSANKVI